MNISDSGFDSGSSPEIHMEDPPMSRTHQYRKVCHYLFVKLFYTYKARAPWVTYMTLTFEDAPLCLVQSFFQEMKIKTNCLIKNQGASSKSVSTVIIRKSRWQWNSWRILTGNKISSLNFIWKTVSITFIFYHWQILCSFLFLFIQKLHHLNNYSLPKTQKKGWKCLSETIT